MDGKKWRILVVDDEPSNLQLMMRILQDQYQMAFATTGVEALDATEKIKPDLILLDVMMPEMDGYEVCRRLKVNERTRDIPVIFITAMREVEDETKGFETGAIDYITKPVRPPVVKARVKNHLELIQAREELRNQNQELIEAARLRENVENITRHDLKNPLGAIIGFAEMLLLTDDLSEKQREWIGFIKNAGYSQLNLINRSLDLFKMEQGSYNLHPTSVDAFQVIKKIIKETWKLAQKKELSVSIRVNGEIPAGDVPFFIQGEELLCYSMLSNLMRNAVEASPLGKQIKVSLDKEEDMAVIRLNNEGMVPEEIRERFFEKYATSGKQKGTGLGTYSAKLITQIHKGQIHMSTSETDGTTIIIRLPTTELSDREMRSQ